MSANEKPQAMPLGWAVFCLVFLLGSMICSVVWINIPIHINLLASISVTLAVAWHNGKSWDELSDALEYGGKICIIPTIIMMMVGVLIAAWIACGTVPMIIYWGLKLINPSIFLVTAAVICAVVSIATGSSWSTAGTVGVALVGIGAGLGINPGMTAGAIISGAYLGDKMSPMSDTTNLAAAVSEGDLFDHIRSMMYTTCPSFVIALVIYGVLGMQFSVHGVDSELVAATLKAIEENFVMSPLLLIPPVIVIGMAIKKYPSIPTLLIATLVAALLAYFIQDRSFSEIVKTLDSGYRVSSGLPQFDTLVNRGGLQSMLWTAALGILGMLYGAIMEKTGLLTGLLERIKPIISSVGGLITTVIMTNIILLAATASQTLAIVVGGRVFVSEFKKKHLLPQVLSRTLEDSGTIVSPLIPWSLCGVYMSGTLGVPALDFVPYAFFCWICPMIAIVYGFTGKFVWKTGEIPSKYTYDDER